MFKITGNKGFHITLPNGITISTQFGGGNYCDNYNNRIETYERGQECRDAEIAIWNAKHDWITSEIFEKATGEELGDDVAGRITVETWLKILDEARKI